MGKTPDQQGGLIPDWEFLSFNSFFFLLRGRGGRLHKHWQIFKVYFWLHISPKLTLLQNSKSIDILFIDLFCLDWKHAIQGGILYIESWWETSCHSCQYISAICRPDGIKSRKFICSIENIMNYGYYFPIDIQQKEI